MNKKELNKLAENVTRLSYLLTRERETLPLPYLKDKDLREAYIRYYVPANLYKVHAPLRELSLHPAGIFRKETDIRRLLCHPELVSGSQTTRSRNKFGMTAVGWAPPTKKARDGGQCPPYTGFPGERLRILDLGSGPGTAILGVMDFFSSHGEKPFLEFIAVDPLSENLRDAERLFQSFRKEVYANASLLTIKSSIERTKSLPEGPFDIIILSNVLSEVFHPDRALSFPKSSIGSLVIIKPDSRLKHAGMTNKGINSREEYGDFRINLLLSLIKRSLASDGSCIIIEPALRATSRDLLEVRDGLLREGLHIYSPCLMNDPCPALTNPKDWCHEDIPWKPPAIVQEVDKLTGLRKDSLKFSYLVIRKDTLSLSDTCGSSPFRVVSEPLISKGKIEYYLCGAGGRLLAVRLDKDKSKLNESFSSLKRGNIVSFEGLIDEGKRLKVDKETPVILNLFQDLKL